MFNSSAAFEKLPCRAVASTARSDFIGGINFQYLICIKFIHVRMNAIGIVILQKCVDYYSFTVLNVLEKFTIR